MSAIGLFPDEWEEIFNTPPADVPGKSHARENSYIAAWKGLHGSSQGPIYQSRPDHHCKHRYHIVFKVQVNGKRVYKKQCVYCYARINEAVAYSEADRIAKQEGLSGIDAIPEMIELDYAYLHEFEQKWTAEIQARAKREYVENFRDQHSEYLKSPAWKAKRAAVMTRCGGTCEGCRQRPATEVHHLNYKGWPGNELLYNLVALCRECHAEAERQEGRKHE